MCFKFFMGLQQTLGEEGVYHGLSAVLDAVSGPAKRG